jgi:putative Mn2+ efflux pump MntP
MKASKELGMNIATIFSIVLGLVSVGFMIVGFINFDQGIFFFFASLILSLVGVGLGYNVWKKDKNSKGALAGLIICSITFLIVMITLYIVNLGT